MTDQTLLKYIAPDDEPVEASFTLVLPSGPELTGTVPLGYTWGQWRSMSDADKAQVMDDFREDHFITSVVVER
jgi:hypothetical protein